MFGPLFPVLHRPSRPSAAHGSRSLFAPDPDPVSDRFLSRDACAALARRIFAMATDGGESLVVLRSRWSGNLRWARNRVTTGGETQFTEAYITRQIQGPVGRAMTNVMDDAALRDTVRRAEAMTLRVDESPEQYPDTPPVVHPILQPTLWFDSTYDVDAEARGRLAASLIAPARAAGVQAAGYVETAAFGAAAISTAEVSRYYPYTTAQYSVTVRDPQHGGSGWAGVDFNDWRRIDTAAITQRALEKCLQSRNPVAVEPGRYTAILEPQATCDLFAPLIETALDREVAENGGGPFAAGHGDSKIGERVLDPRLTVSADPMDPDCGFLPFDGSGEPFVPVTWIENGVLRQLSYPRIYGLRQLQLDAALPNPLAFRLSGGSNTIEEMIASTERGVLVTRLSNVIVLRLETLLVTGTTRDGLWLIERGKIAKPIKNFRFTESPLFALNNLEQVGIPQRVFRPVAPAVCPAVKVRDFGFTSLMDAV